MEKILVLDIETTGIHLQKDDPIQIGYVVYEGSEKVEEVEIFLKTEYLPPKITQITGITKEELDEKGMSHIAAAKTWNDAMRRIDPDYVIGHNVIGFDFMLLSNWLLRTLVNDRFPLPATNALRDTMMMAKKHFKISKWLSLKELASRLEIDFDQSKLHKALYDVEVTAKCYFAMTRAADAKAVQRPRDQQLLF